MFSLSHGFKFAMKWSVMLGLNHVTREARGVLLSTLSALPIFVNKLHLHSNFCRLSCPRPMTNSCDLMIANSPTVASYRRGRDDK